MHIYICMYIYVPRCAARKSATALFKRNCEFVLGLGGGASLRDTWQYACAFYHVTLGVSGEVGGVPARDSPNDMVNCVYNLLYGISSEACWASQGVMEVLGWIGGARGGIEGVPGSFVEGPWGALGKDHLVFLRG